MFKRSTFLGWCHNLHGINSLEKEIVMVVCYVSLVFTMSFTECLSDSFAHFTSQVIYTIFLQVMFGNKVMQFISLNQVMYVM